MSSRASAVLAGLLVSAGALAQQPAPAFAPPHLTGNGPRAMAANCSPCHGTNGRVAAGSPVNGLAGRPAGEIMQRMGQFKAGTRPATVMHQIAKGFSDEEIAAIAAYFEKQY